MINPIDLLNRWLQDERLAGAPDPQQAILSSVTNEAVPHARVVAIREINESGFLFFTQRGSRKVGELIQNPVSAITFWFELLQREVIIEGVTSPLSARDNDLYWQSYSRNAQIRFYSYAPTSSQPIISKQLLEDKRKQVELDYNGKQLPVSELYCGFRLKPARFVFYAYRTDELSDVCEYRHTEQGWTKQFLSP